MNVTKTWLTGLGVAILLTIMGVTATQSLRCKSPTVDEFAHLPAGYYYWKTGDFSLYGKTPPLIRLLCALPLLKENISIDWSLSHQEGGDWRPWVFGTHFMRQNESTYDHLFFMGRMPVVLLALCLGLFVFQWSKALYGPLGGIISLAFYAFSPNILAHSRLVTTDLGFTCFMFLTLYYTWKTFALGVSRAWVPAGLFLGCTLLSKFTGLLLLPVLVVLPFLTASPSEQGRENNGSVTRKTKAPVAALWNKGKTALRPLALIIVLALFVVNLGYGFRESFPTLSQLSPKSRLLQALNVRPLNLLPLPVPAPFVRGFDSQKIDAEQGEFLNYLRGTISNKGWWYYFLYAFCVKAPLSVLFGLSLSIWIACRHRKRVRGQVYLVVPMVVMVGVFSFFNKLDIGIRYILPAFPFLFVLMGNLAQGGWPRRLHWAVVGAVVVAHIAASYSVFPHYLAFFNRLAGGPEKGHEHLLDSNLDWGQDLKGLGKYLNAKGIQEVGLAYFGHVDPQIYGISYHPLDEASKTGPIAISANFLFGLPYVLTYTDPPRIIQPGAFEWLQRQKPTAHIGYSMYIFSNGGN